MWQESAMRVNADQAHSYGRPELIYRTEDAYGWSTVMSTSSSAARASSFAFSGRQQQVMALRSGGPAGVGASPYA